MARGWFAFLLLEIVLLKNFFFSVLLVKSIHKHPYLVTCLIHITRVSQVQDTFTATLHYQLAYRLQNHAFDMAVLDMAQFNDALLIKVDPRMTPMCTFGCGSWPSKSNFWVIVLYFEFIENKLFCWRGGSGLAGVKHTFYVFYASSWSNLFSRENMRKKC